MGKSIRGLVYVSTYPSDGVSEDSYIRCRDIQRVSMVENQDSTISILVHAFGSAYLSTVAESLSEATLQLEILAEEIIG